MKNEFHSIGGRIAVDLNSFNLPISEEEALRILAHKGFRVFRYNIALHARSLVGSSAYRRGAKFRQAPEYLDCSLLPMYLYSMMGIEIPRRSIQQFGAGEEVSDFFAGDLLFTTGHGNYYDVDPEISIGHVGVATGEGSVIHASGPKKGIVGCSVEKFCGGESFRGARRIIPDGANITTFIIPPDYEVWRSSDIRWIILQQLER